MESNIKFKTTQNPFINKNQHLTIRYQLYQPPEHQMSKFLMIFYAMIGGFASVVQTQITDTYNLVKEDKRLFRMEAKKRLTEAKEQADALIAAFKYYTEQIDMYQLWLDLTDIIEDDLKPDVMKCFFAIDNQFMKHGVDKHKMYTMILVSEIMSGMLVTSVNEFAKVMREQNGIHTFNIAERFSEPIKGVHTRMRNAMEILYPEKVDKLVFSECPGKFNLGFEIIGLKVLDWKRADKALEQAVNMSGLNLTIDGQENEAPHCNTGTPWNEAQIRALKMAYSDTPNKEIATIVGRSVYEVAKQAKKLGLKKSKEYLREIRMSNIKRN